MSKTYKIRKGLDLKLVGEADKVLATAEKPSAFAIKPTDFHGIIPKMLLKEGGKVKVGTPIFYSKDNPEIMFTSPVSGEIAEIIRGEKRKILEIRILPDAEFEYEDFGTHNPESISREALLELILKSGMFAFFKQRPFDVIADPKDTPKNIFVSAFDSAPLAADYDFIIHNSDAADYQAGLDALAKLTSGKVHLGLSSSTTEGAFKSAKNVVPSVFDGPHPAGNVGVQIHHIAPINTGDVVWTLSSQAVLSLGKLLRTGKFDNSRIVAIVGSGIKTPKYFRTFIGANINDLIKDIVKDDADYRVVSGNVLSGENVGKNGFLGYFHNSICVIPEGNEHKFILSEGWLSLGLSNKKFSISRTFPSWLFPNKKYDLDTNLHGEHRAFVVTGQYEKVFPMDIYPQQLVKSIIIKDIELMEQLGIYEVAPEDFALCEFVCTSKMDVQKIVREGLDMLKKELS
jgi:Na+-transporting NADH:ubiquinone oxidoreductase subunit A